MENKLENAISAIKSGVPIEEASRDVDWKDFEGPTMEIDVVGIHLGTAVLIDCKHWKRMTNSALENIVLKQIDRVKHYVTKTDEVMAAPVIVTLYQEGVKLVNKVPIVPIMQFSSFIDEFYGNLEEIRTVEK